MMFRRESKRKKHVTDIQYMRNMLNTVYVYAWITHAHYTLMCKSFIVYSFMTVQNKAMALKPERFRTHLYVQNKERHCSQQFQRVKVESLGFGSQRNSVSKHVLCRLKLCMLFERLSQLSSVSSDVTGGPYQNDLTPNNIREDLRGEKYS